MRTGAHDVVLDPRQRWYRRLYADPFVDVWLISWATEQATELHDHAGSLGALTVVSGELQEQRWVPAERALRTRRLRAGRARPSRWATCTTWSTASRRHAVSVHAYSPPLTAMSYYAVDAAGDLRRTRTVLTTGGERHDHGGRPARRGPRPAGPGVPAAAASWSPTARCSSTPARSGSATTRAPCPGALVIERNHLEWRLDPASDARIPQATDHDVTWIVVCSEGYSSSLAAASLQDLGLRNATDLDGGFRAWKAAGLPVRVRRPTAVHTALLSLHDRTCKTRR